MYVLYGTLLPQRDEISLLPAGPIARCSSHVYMDRYRRYQGYVQPFEGTVGTEPTVPTVERFLFGTERYIIYPQPPWPINSATAGIRGRQVPARPAPVCARRRHRLLRRACICTPHLASHFCSLRTVRERSPQRANPPHPSAKRRPRPRDCAALHAFRRQSVNQRNAHVSTWRGQTAPLCGAQLHLADIRVSALRFAAPSKGKPNCCVCAKGPHTTVTLPTYS